MFLNLAHHPPPSISTTSYKCRGIPWSAAKKTSILPPPIDHKLINTIEQTKAPAWGVYGGMGSAASNAVILSPDTPQEQPIGKTSDRVLPAGDRLAIHTGGGGGWGDPLEREPARVLADVRGGYVSLESAKRDYGVVIRQADGQYVVDEAGTAKLRGTRRKAA